jgi:hypothetical protein
MAPTTNTTKPVATAIATFVSIDKFIIFPFNYYGTPPVAPVFWILRYFTIASNFGVFMAARNTFIHLPCLSIAELVFWTTVEGLRSQKTKEESQPPVRAKIGATLVLHRSQNQLL